MIEKTMIMDQIGTTEGRTQTGEGSFDDSLGVIGKLGVRTAARAKEWQMIVLRHLGHGGGHDVHLGRTIGENGGGHIHNRCQRAIDDRRASSDKLGNDKAAQRFSTALHDGAGKGGRGGGAGLKPGI